MPPRPRSSVGPSKGTMKRSARATDFQRSLALAEALNPLEIPLSAPPPCSSTTSLVPVQATEASPSERQYPPNPMSIAQHHQGEGPSTGMKVTTSGGSRRGLNRKARPQGLNREAYDSDSEQDPRTTRQARRRSVGERDGVGELALQLRNATISNTLLLSEEAQQIEERDARSERRQRHRNARSQVTRLGRKLAVLMRHKGAEGDDRCDEEISQLRELIRVEEEEIELMEREVKLAGRSSHGGLSERKR
jgi:hypothetical protein